MALRDVFIKGNREQIQTCIEQRQFYRYRLHICKREFSLIFYTSRLFQQYYVDAFAACKATALDWIRKNQNKIYTNVYGGLQDNLIVTDADLYELGCHVVLLSSFTVRNRFMQQRFQDSMAIVRHFKRPNYFITAITNPR